MVSADQPEPVFDPALVGRAHRAIDPLHSQLYFAPEQDEHLGAVGIKPGRMAYFAGRSAPMGAVGAGVVTATFYNFSPSLVAHMIPRAWTMASPEQVVAARFDAARASLTRLLGEEVAGSPEVAELAGLLREACADLSPEARPLYAAHAVPVSPGWYDVALNTPVMDTSRARDELGWVPRYSSTEGARELLDGLADGVVGPTAAMGA